MKNKMKWKCPLPSCGREFVYRKNAKKHCDAHELWNWGWEEEKEGKK
jgi:hypothetical protein